MNFDRNPTNWVYDNSRNTHSEVPELIMAGYKRMIEAYPLTEHCHPNAFEIVFVESGNVTWQVDETLFPTYSGQLFYIRPNELHGAKLNFIEPGKIWWIIIADPSAVSGWLNLGETERTIICSQLHKLPRVIAGKWKIKEGFCQLRTILEHGGDPLWAVKVRMYILDIVFQALQPSAGRQVPADLKKAIVRLAKSIREQPAERWIVKEIAEQMGISLPHFHRLFQEVLGQPPARFIDRVRMERAEELLHRTDCSITDISQKLGYATSQHFTTVFKKYKGFTPKQWRNDHRGQGSVSAHSAAYAESDPALRRPE